MSEKHRLKGLTIVVDHLKFSITFKNNCFFTTSNNFGYLCKCGIKKETLREIKKLAISSPFSLVNRRKSYINTFAVLQSAKPGRSSQQCVKIFQKIFVYGKKDELFFREMLFETSTKLKVSSQYMVSFMTRSLYTHKQKYNFVLPTTYHF